MGKSAVFLVHLLQDVQVLRPLIFMAARDFGLETQLLVSDKFRARDTTGAWLREIESMCSESGSQLNFFGDDWQAQTHLKGQGLLIAASESHIHNHVITHNIFRHAPAGYLKVTLQHGFECVGFRHGADHARAYGDTASFAADIVCAWYGREHLTALAPSQAPKLVVTGPTLLLQTATGPVTPGKRPGLVCENLHSVRFESAEKLEQEFLQTFRKFAGAMHRYGHSVRLRPHPGGQYSVRPDAVLPRNVVLENAPLYRLDLRQFSYGVSPPSSVLIDMLIADIPTAVWRDRRGLVDVSNYEGLATVSSADELIVFARNAERDRDRFVATQRAWLERQGMPLNPADVYARFAGLFEMAERMEVRPVGARPERERLLIITGEERPLPPALAEAMAALIANGEITSQTVSAKHLRVSGVGGVTKALNAYAPSAILFCGQGVIDYKLIFRWANNQRVPTIGLWGLDAAEPEVPAQESSSGIEEVAAASELLHGADVIYASSEELKIHLERALPELRTVVGRDAQTELGDQKSPPPLRDELLRIIALGHSAVSTQVGRAQKEIGVCHAQ